MKRIFRLQLLVCPSVNRKSKTCPFDKLRAGSERYRRIQNKKWAGLFAIVVALAVYGASAKAQSTKVHRIGYLTGSSPSAQSARIEAFRQGLRELGYVEGEHIDIEY